MPKSTAPTTTRSREVLVWGRLVERMRQWDPDWRVRIGIDIPATLTRSTGTGPPISNEEAFEAFAVALLSGNTRWDRIERVRDALREPFDDFEPAVFAGRNDRSIDETVVPWFRERRAGAAGLREEP